MRIANGSVFRDGAFVGDDVFTSGALFSDESVDGEVLDATDCYVIPGLVDIHFHGCVGSDVCDATHEALSSMAKYEASRGVTAICPATMTFPTEKLVSVLQNASQCVQDAFESALVGINMEGPFISPNKVGAQNPAYVRAPDPDEFRMLQKVAGGLVKLVDIAPEEAGALEFIGAVGDEVRVSVAHTCVDYAQACAAFERGAKHVTHLYNAMPGLHHRDPGPIAAAVEHSEVTPEIIADGIHVHPAMVRLAFSMFGADRMILISDTMRACGLEDGTYDLGGQQVNVCGKRAELADGTLAGSVSDLMTCLRTAVLEMGIPFEDALRAATINPARAIGVDAERGSIAPGKIADAVVLSKSLEIEAVVLRGVVIAAS